MSIRYKLLLPSLLLLLVLGGAAYWIMNSLLEDMLYESAEKIIRNKQEEILLGTNTLSKKALQSAAIFSRLPQVVAAYELALAGDIDNESDPRVQEARELLRASLAPAMQGVQAVSKNPLKVHFHLPNGRSLVRLWREKQARRGGRWVDVSDDLSGFRNTVLDVNSSGKPVAGLELGRGGFVLRGLAPVRAPDGRQLGSVEVLTDFARMLKGKSKQREEELLLFMNADLLPITTALQDKEQYPVLPGGFVRLFDSSQGAAGQYFSGEDLQRGARGIFRDNHGDVVLATFPLEDYKGEQVGVIGFTRDLSSEQSYVNMVGMTLAGLMLLVMAAFIAVSFYVLVRYVFRPVTSVVQTITDITQDKADLDDRLEYQANDEIGELCRRFNGLMDKIVSLVNLSQNVLDAIPDPVFAMDKDFNIILANEAVAHLAGCGIEQVKGRKCAEVFKTTVCGTGLCPVQQVKDDPSRARGSFDFVHSRLDSPGSEGEDWYIHPHVAEIKDYQGNVSGYVELVKDVTSHVQSEESIKNNLQCVQHINTRLQETAERIVRMSDSVSQQAQQVRQGAETQSSRMAETSRSMDNMNQSIMDVARNAATAASHNQVTSEKAREGADVVQRSIASIGQVHEQTQSLKHSLTELAEQAQGIGAIMNVISDIADQTNLLALNAAIEAARAGESGRGFAVVADEVRKLAEKTMDATKQVGQAIDNIQRHSKVNIENMDQAAHTVDEAMRQADASGAALREIVELVGKASDQVNAIATASEEQSTASEEIAGSVDEVTRISRETAEGMEEQVRTLAELAGLTQELSSLAEEQ